MHELTVFDHEVEQRLPFRRPHLKIRKRIDRIQRRLVQHRAERRRTAILPCRVDRRQAEIAHRGEALAEIRLAAYFQPPLVKDMAQPPVERDQRIRMLRQRAAELRQTAQVRRFQPPQGGGVRLPVELARFRRQSKKYPVHLEIAAAMQRIFPGQFQQGRDPPGRVVRPFPARQGPDFVRFADVEVEPLQVAVERLGALDRGQPLAVDLPHRVAVAPANFRDRRAKFRIVLRRRNRLLQGLPHVAFVAAVGPRRADEAAAIHFAVVPLPHQPILQIDRPAHVPHAQFPRHLGLEQGRHELLADGRVGGIQRMGCFRRAQGLVHVGRIISKPENRLPQEMRSLPFRRSLRRNAPARQGVAHPCGHLSGHPGIHVPGGKPLFPQHRAGGIRQPDCGLHAGGIRAPPERQLRHGHRPGKRHDLAGGLPLFVEHPQPPALQHRQPLRTRQLALHQAADAFQRRAVFLRQVLVADRQDADRAAGLARTFPLEQGPAHAGRDHSDRFVQAGRQRGVPQPRAGPRIEHHQAQRIRGGGIELDHAQHVRRQQLPRPQRQRFVPRQRPRPLLLGEQPVDRLAFEQIDRWFGRQSRRREVHHALRDLAPLQGDQRHAHVRLRAGGPQQRQRARESPAVRAVHDCPSDHNVRPAISPVSAAGVPRSARRLPARRPCPRFLRSGPPRPSSGGPWR